MVANPCQKCCKSEGPPDTTTRTRNFYLISTIVWAATGGLILAFSAAIELFFCHVDARIIGCDNCPDKLIMCYKTDPCFLYATNVTYLKYAYVSSDYLYSSLNLAVLDTECNALVAAASDPVEFMKEAVSQSAAGTLSLTDECLAFQCEVLQQALMFSTDLNTLSGTDCTDTLDVKIYDDDKTSCPCVYDYTYAEAATFETLCGITGDALQIWLFNQTVVSKGTCYDESMQSAFASSFASTSDTETDSDCLALLTDANSLVDSVNSISDSTPSTCVSIYCYALNVSFFSPYCNWTTDSYLSQTSEDDIDTMNSACSSNIPRMATTDWTKNLLCNYLDQSYCTDSSVSRRVVAEDLTQTLDRIPQTLDRSPQTLDGSPTRNESVRVRGGACGGTCAKSRVSARRLQSGDVANEDLDPYEEGEWSMCTCYFQCLPGVMTRSVVCNSEQCQGPKPAETMSCTCGNCADCDVTMNLFLLWITFFAQGGVALLNFIAFVAYGKKEKEDMTKHGCCAKTVGFFCKNIPTITRFLILVNLGQIGFILVQVWMPSSLFAFQVDCIESTDLRTVSLGAFVCLFLQLIMGKITTMVGRKPPWLFSPQRSTLRKPFKQIQEFLVSVSP